MKLRLAIAAAALAFVLLSTANSAGYRYGVSDQAFYIPAIALTMNGALFPRDRLIFAPQMHLWLGGDLFAWLARAAGGDLPRLFALLYLATLLVLFAGGLALARALAWDRWTTAAFLVLLTVRHRIAKTGANTLEGYMHPRMLAFAIGLLALAFAVRRRFAIAIALVAAALVIHPTTALWFGVVIGVAVWWPHRRRTAWLAPIGALAVIGAIVARVWLARGFVRMDDAWLAVVSDRDYLFASGWPFYAWAINLAYPVVIGLVYARRRRLGVAVAGEAAIVAGLVALAIVFLLSVPFTAMHVALAVQLQVNRAFWLLDTVALGYVAWLWLSFAARWRPRTRTIAVAGLAALAAARGAYVVRGRPFFQVDLPATSWTDAMRWLARQPASWNVLADPSQAWHDGASVRIAALKDMPLDASKDPALAIYSRDVAMRVADAERRLANFDTFTAADVRALAARDDLDVFVDDASRRAFDFPVLFRNDRFVVYRLR